MNELNQLFNLDFKYLFVGFVLLLVVVKFLWTLLEWIFVDKLGLETKTQRERNAALKQLDDTTILARQTAENLNKLEERHTKDEKEFRNNLNRHMTESEKDRKALHQEMRRYSENRIKDREQSIMIQKELTTSMNKLESLLLDKQISDYRWEIINVADKISNGRIVSKECLKHAIATYDKYEKIIKEHNLVNGEVTISIGVITDEYSKVLSDEK